MLINNSPTTTHIAPKFLPKVVQNEHDRESLITSHLSKVKYIADRMAAKLPPSVERDDLYGAGVLGLIDAVERFDFTRGTAFTTFAEMRVRGAILDSLRALDWVSRAARRRSKEVKNAFAEIEKKHGRTANDEEVAEYLKISVSELYEVLGEMRGLIVTDLDERDTQTGLSVLDTIFDSAASPLEQFEEQDRSRRLSKAIDGLPERERQIITLSYVEELNLKEIGSILGVTESRVSQLRTQAILRLRVNLQNRKPVSKH